MRKEHFLLHYIDQLRTIETEEHVGQLYEWFWNLRDELSDVVAAINAELNLVGDVTLQPDLPCLAVGSLRGLVFVSANPGWIPDLNRIEDACCRSSAEAYKKLMFNYFVEHPRILGGPVRWWAQPIRLLPKLLKSAATIGYDKVAIIRWRQAHESGLLGGWELFPFHSVSDGLTPRTDVGWVGICLEESLRAILRIGPEMIVVASKTGFDLIRKLTPKLKWQDLVLAGTRVALSKTGETEIVAIANQMFSAPRKFTNDQLIKLINDFRNYSNGMPGLPL